MEHRPFLIESKSLVKGSLVKRAWRTREQRGIYGILGQLLSYAAVGAIGTAAQYAVLVALVEISVIDPVVGSGCGFIAGLLVNYFLNYHFTFRSEKKHYKAIIKFFCVALSGLAWTAGIMAFATRVVGVHYIIGQVCATAFVLLWGFSFNRLWTFRSNVRGHGK
jgi:putative flippase GtrA